MRPSASHDPSCRIASILYILVKAIAMMKINSKEQPTHSPESSQKREAATADPVAPSEALEEHRLTASEIEQLKEQAAKANEHWEQLLRVAADFENFKKRAARERQET